MSDQNQEILAECMELLRNLADLQNGPPLIKYEQEHNEIMQKIYEFLEKYEK